MYKTNGQAKVKVLESILVQIEKRTVPTPFIARYPIFMNTTLVI